MGCFQSNEHSNSDKNASFVTIDNNKNDEKFESKNNNNNNDDLDITKFTPLFVYGAGLFGNWDDETSIKYWQQQLSDLKSASNKFNTILLWALNVDAFGNLQYGNGIDKDKTHKFITNGVLDPLFDKTKINIKQGISELKQCNIPNVGFSIGFSSPPCVDWERLTAIIKQDPTSITFTQNLFKNFQVLIGLGVNIIDSDCEEWNLDSAPDADEFNGHLIETHVQLYTKLYDMGIPLFTCSPYSVHTCWIEICAQIYNKKQKQIIKWWNLQTYAADIPAYDPKTWNGYLIQDYEQMGLSKEEAQNYIVAGCKAHFTDDNSDLGKITNKLKGADYSQYINGAGIFNIDRMYNEDKGVTGNWADKYCKALIDGLKK